MSHEAIRKILVTGASGNLGSAVLNALTDAGFTLRAGCRHPGNIPSLPGVETVRLDYVDAPSVEAALGGMEGLFLVAPPLDPHAPAKLIPVIDKAKEAGISHIVFNSAMGMDKSEQSPLRIIERHLMASGVNYTILRPNFFMENFSKGFIAPTIAQGGIFLPAGDGKTSFISAVDIASVTVVVFRDRHFGKEYNLTGPETIDHVEVARVISHVSGRDVTYHDISEERMMHAAREQGMPDDAVQYMALLFKAVRGGMTADMTDTVLQLTGKRPMKFEEFARMKAAAWT